MFVANAGEFRRRGVAVVRFSPRERRLAVFVSESGYGYGLNVRISRTVAVYVTYPSSSQPGSVTVDTTLAVTVSVCQS